MAAVKLFCVARLLRVRLDRRLTFLNEPTWAGSWRTWRTTLLKMAGHRRFAYGPSLADKGGHTEEGQVGSIVRKIISPLHFIADKNIRNAIKTS